MYDDDNLSLAAQAELLRFYEEKRRREQEDAQLASSFLGGVSNNNHTRPQPSIFSMGGDDDEDADMLLALKLQEEEEQEERNRQERERKRREDEDILFARRLEEEERVQLEQQRRAAERDALLAQQMLEEEKEKIQREKERREWEATMNLIRTEAKSESDRELARVLREKEQLEAELEREKRLKVISASEGHSMLSLTDIDYPPYWEDSSEGFTVFDVVKRSIEWDTVSRLFTVGMPNTTIQKIERNQNKQLWTWYWLKKYEITQKLGYSNEQTVFHGSRADAYDLILRGGFDHRVAAMTGAIGAGVYFAFSSATSNGYIPGNQKWKKMLVCKVILGDMGPGQSGLRRPPAKANGQLYDSVGREGSMCVVFDNNQAYPEYTVYFSG